MDGKNQRSLGWGCRRGRWSHTPVAQRLQTARLRGMALVQNYPVMGGGMGTGVCVLVDTGWWHRQTFTSSLVDEEMKCCRGKLQPSHGDMTRKQTINFPFLLEYMATRIKRRLKYTCVLDKWELSSTATHTWQVFADLQVLNCSLTSTHRTREALLLGYGGAEVWVLKTKVRCRAAPWSARLPCKSLQVRNWWVSESKGRVSVPSYCSRAKGHS